MKKIMRAICFVLCAAMALSFAGCSSGVLKTSKLSSNGIVIKSVSLDETLVMEVGDVVELPITFTFEKENLSEEKKEKAISDLGMNVLPEDKRLLEIDGFTLTAICGGETDVWVNDPDGKFNSCIHVVITGDMSILRQEVTDADFVGSKKRVQTVDENGNEIISADKIEIIQGDTKQITVHAAKFHEYKYSSADESVAVVDSDGYVTGIAPGITEVTIKSNNGLTCTCQIIIDENLDVTTNGTDIAQKNIGDDYEIELPTDFDIRFEDDDYEKLYDDENSGSSLESDLGNAIAGELGN